VKRRIWQCETRRMSLKNGHPPEHKWFADLAAMMYGRYLDLGLREKEPTLRPHAPLGSEHEPATSTQQLQPAVQVAIGNDVSQRFRHPPPILSTSVTPPLSHFFSLAFAHFCSPSVTPFLHPGRARVRAGCREPPPANCLYPYHFLLFPSTCFSSFLTTRS
jgi:hypothetical protein